MEIRLVLDNVWTSVQGADAGAVDVIIEATRYRPQGYQFHRLFIKRLWNGYKNLYDKRGKRFPTGLVPRVQDALGKAGYQVTLRDDRVTPSDIDLNVTLKGIELRPQQVEAIELAAEAGRGILKASTGFGKTEIFGALIKVFCVPTLVLVPDRALLNQAVTRLRTRIPELEIGAIGDGEWQVEDVTVATFQTLLKRLEGGWNSSQLSAAKKKLATGEITKRQYEDIILLGKERDVIRQDTINVLSEFDMVLVDEVKHARGTAWLNVLETCPAYHRFGFDATPFTSPPGSEILLIGQTGEIIYDFTLEDAIDAGISIQPLAWFLNYEGNDQEPEIRIGRFPRKTESYQEAYTVAIVENEHRNRAVITAARAAEAAKLPTMITVTRIEHGEILSRELGWPFLHGKVTTGKRNTVIRRVNTGKTPGFISTVSKEGLDIPNLACIINASGGKAQHTVIQTIGRGVRRGIHEYCVYADFVDRQTANFKTHTRSRMNALKNEKVPYETASSLPDIGNKTLMRKLAGLENVVA